MRSYALRLLAALIVVSLLASACGDDEPPTDSAAESTTTTHDHAEAGDYDDGEMDGGHGHAEPVEFLAADIPTIEIDVTPDPAGGINVVVETSGYSIAPEAASTDHVDGEGHFHLWIDGVKVQRFYNEAIHYVGVTEGDVEVMVELSANDHRPYAVDGVPIVATASLAVPAHSHDDHGHGEDARVEWEGDPPVLAIEVVEDPKSGHNAFLTVTGLELSAENASGAHVAGQGHLHIYANGQKLGRLYGTATHIPALPAGEVEISIVAYTNDHAVSVLDGEPIEATATITVAS